jgi:hypothetical protein
MLYTAREVAESLNVSTRFVQRVARGMEIPLSANPIGGMAYLFDADDVHAIKRAITEKLARPQTMRLKKTAKTLVECPYSCQWPRTYRIKAGPMVCQLCHRIEKAQQAGRYQEAERLESELSCQVAAYAVEQTEEAVNAA